MTVTLILLASQQIVVEANWVGAGEKDKGESPPHWRQPVPAKGVGPVGAACRALAGPSHPGATLQNPARLHRGTCLADCFSRPPRAVGVVHERGGDRATGQGGSSQVYRIERAWGRCLFNLHSVSRPFCFSCAWASITVQAE